MNVFKHISDWVRLSFKDNYRLQCKRTGEIRPQFGIKIKHRKIPKCSALEGHTADYDDSPKKYFHHVGKLVVITSGIFRSTLFQPSWLFRR